MTLAKKQLTALLKLLRSQQCKKKKKILTNTSLEYKGFCEVFFRVCLDFLNIQNIKTIFLIYRNADLTSQKLS